MFIHQHNSQTNMSDELNFISSNISNEWIQNNKEAQNILELFINTDINLTSLPAFDSSILSVESFYLRKDILVQVDEIVDISIPYAERCDFKMGKNGTLKLLLDDGSLKFIGISKTRIEYFNPLLQPGLKIIIKKGTLIKYGVVFLDNENIKIIGGKSDIQIERRRSIVVYNPKEYLIQNKMEVDKPKNTEKKTKRTRKNQIKTVHLEIVHNNQKNTEFLSSDDDIIISDNFNNDTINKRKEILGISDIVKRDENTAISYFQLSKNCFIEEFGNLSIAKNLSSLYFALSCMVSDKKDHIMLRIAKQEIQKYIDSTPEDWMKMDTNEQNLKFRKLKEMLLVHLNPITLIDRGKGNPNERYVVCSNELAKSVNVK